MLTKFAILSALHEDDIEIAPFNAAQLGPNSYDLRLAPKLFALCGILDTKETPKYNELEITEEGLLLEPQTLYLGATVERTNTPYHIPVVEGKSTCGRYGICVHQTAGIGDIGFDGHWTLEITVTNPVIVYPNMRICQIMFYEPIGKLDRYKGNYQNNSPVPKLPNPSSLV